MDITAGSEHGRQVALPRLTNSRAVWTTQIVSQDLACEVRIEGMKGTYFAI